MDNPHGGKTNPADKNFFHHDKTECHHKRKRNYNGNFCYDGHSSFLNERFEVFFIQFCADEPIMQPLGAVGKTKQRQQKKRRCR